MLKDADATLVPEEANKAELRVAHTERYLESLNVCV